MILDKETFEKFGYRPNTLSKFSKKKIIWECDSCGKRSVNTMVGRLGAKTEFCRSCRQTIKLDLNSYTPPSPELLCRVLYSGNINGRCNFIYVSGKHLSRQETLSILKFLNISNPSTSALKDACLKHLLALDEPSLFKILCYFFNNIRPLYFPKKLAGRRAVVGDKNGFLRAVFKKLRFDFYVRPGSHNETLYITKGSFFLGGRWVHIE